MLQGGRPRAVADHQPLLDAALGQAASHAATELAGGPRLPDQGEVVNRTALFQGSRSSSPPSRPSASIPAASTRPRSAARASSSSTTVHQRRPTDDGGAGGTPSPRQVLNAR